MPVLDIIPVRSGSESRAFLRLPERLYARDPNWVCPLRVERREFFDPRKNPFFEEADVQLFLAKRNGRVVGRISAHIYHPHNRVHRERAGFFGFFECENDYEIAESLWTTAASWLRERGMDTMRGPFCFTTNHDGAGFLVDGFDQPPVVMMSYNPPYYPQFAVRYKFTKAMDLYAYWGSADDPFDARMERVVERIRTRSGVTIRPLNMSHFDDEVARVKAIYDRAWAPNWGFVPMSEAEFAHMAKSLRQLVDPEVVLFAEADGQTVGFLLALPDINQVLIHLNGRLLPFGLIKMLWLWKVRRIIHRVRVPIMGVLPEFQKRGIESMLIHGIYARGIPCGYRETETSWILETNTMMNAVAETLGYKRYKTYRVYEMRL